MQESIFFFCLFADWIGTSIPLKEPSISKEIHSRLNRLHKPTHPLIEQQTSSIGNQALELSVYKDRVQTGRADKSWNTRVNNTTSWVICSETVEIWPQTTTQAPDVVSLLVFLLIQFQPWSSWFSLLW